MEDNKPEIKMEFLKAESIKPAIREAYGLPEFGIVLKRSIRTSPSCDTYEFVSSSFLSRLNKNIDSLSPSIIQKLGSMR